MSKIYSKNHDKVDINREELRKTYMKEVISYVSLLNLLNMKTIINDEIKKRKMSVDGTSLWDKLPMHIQLYILKQKKILEEEAKKFLMTNKDQLSVLNKKLLNAIIRYNNYRSSYQTSLIIVQKKTKPAII